MYVRGPHKNLGSFERSLRIFPYYIPMKYETTQLSQTISVGGCGTVKERSRAVGLTAFWLATGTNKSIVVPDLSYVDV